MKKDLPLPVVIAVIALVVALAAAYYIWFFQQCTAWNPWMLDGPTKPPVMPGPGGAAPAPVPPAPPAGGSPSTGPQGST